MRLMPWLSLSDEREFSEKYPSLYQTVLELHNSTTELQKALERVTQ